jgi:hypothetical protein
MFKNIIAKIYRIISYILPTHIRFLRSYFIERYKTQIKKNAWEKAQKTMFKNGCVLLPIKLNFNEVN